jgi:hypothetical protein
VSSFLIWNEASLVVNRELVVVRGCHDAWSRDARAAIVARGFAVDTRHPSPTRAYRPEVA